MSKNSTVPNIVKICIKNVTLRVGILDNFLWLEYWTTSSLGVHLWLEYWTTLVLADFTFGWNTGQLQTLGFVYGWNTGQLWFWPFSHLVGILDNFRLRLSLLVGILGNFGIFAESSRRALYSRIPRQEVVQYSNQKRRYKRKVIQ